MPAVDRQKQGIFQTRSATQKKPAAPLRESGRLQAGFPPQRECLS